MRLTGSLAAGELTGDMFALYEPPTPAGLSDDPERRAYGAVTIIGCDDDAAPTEVLVMHREPKHGGTFHQLPFALTPGAPFPTKALRESIDAFATEVAAGLPGLPPSAVVDIPLRCPPRTRGPLPRTATASPTSPPRSWPWTRPTWRCTARPAPVRRTPPRG